MGETEQYPPFGGYLAPIQGQPIALHYLFSLGLLRFFLLSVFKEQKDCYGKPSLLPGLRIDLSIISVITPDREVPLEQAACLSAKNMPGESY